MKKMVVIMIMVGTLFSGCVIVKMMDNNKMSSTGVPTVVIVAVESKTIRDQMKTLQKTFSGSVLITSKKFFAFGYAKKDVLRQIQNRGIVGPLVLIGYSGFGKVVREIDEDNSGLVVAVVTIGTALGKFRFVPEFFSDIALRPADSNSKTPLFVIGSFVENPPVDHWWVKDKKHSDGIVDIATVMDTGDREVAGKAIIEGDEHHQLLEDQRAMNQIKEWLEPYLKVKEKNN